MDDLAGLHGIYPNSLRWNSIEGTLSLVVFDEALWARIPRPVSPGSRWAVDMLRRERGYGKATDKEFKMYLSPVGAPLPPNIPEDDPELKPALSMALWSPSFGDAVMTTCGAIVRTAVNAMWTRYRSFREASDGLLPIITFGEAHEIEVAKRAFQAPQIDITGWVKRETIPSFALLPPTVSPPPPVDAQIGFSAIPAITTKAKHKPPKAGTLRDMLDDKIPDLES